MSHALSDLLTRQVARFTDREADWDAFADARVEGYRRAQHRFIGSGASGKADASVIPADHFTLSVMFVPAGQGNAPHTHEVEEVFFILRGKVKVFIEDGAGGRAETVLGPWDCVSCPANVIHGFVNVGVEPAYLQVMLGKARPDLMTYTDAALQQRRDEHLGLEGGLRPPSASPQDHWEGASTAPSHASPQEGVAPARPALERPIPRARPLSDSAGRDL